MKVKSMAKQELVTKWQKGRNMGPKVTVRNRQAEIIKKVGNVLMRPIKKFKENQEKMAEEGLKRTKSREATRAKFRK